MKPHPPWVTLTSTAAVIPMPASTAIRGRSGRCHFLASRAVLACDVRPPDGAASTR
jgi:hypothetical protein